MYVSNWREVIVVYSVKYSNSDDVDLALYLNEDNIGKLKNVFNKFNTIKEYETIEKFKRRVTNYYGEEKTIMVNQTVLHVKIDSKSF